VGQNPPHLISDFLFLMMIAINLFFPPSLTVDFFSSFFPPSQVFLFPSRSSPVPLSGLNPQLRGLLSPRAPFPRSSRSLDGSLLPTSLFHWGVLLHPLLWTLGIELYQVSPWFITPSRFSLVSLRSREPYRWGSTCRCMRWAFRCIY